MALGRLMQRMVSEDVINDLDSGGMNFFTVLQDEEKYERLLRLLSLTPVQPETI
jgi:hypothetical protein